MVIYDHEKERRILERRLELLDVLDSIIRRDIAFGVNTDTESPEVKHITEQFREGADPMRRMRCFKAIYKGKPGAFGPAMPEDDC